MIKYFRILIIIFVFSCNSPKENSLSENNQEMAQSFLDNIITNPEQAQSLLHKDFTFAWMGIIEQGGKIWNRENLFDEYFKKIWEFYFCYCEGGFDEAALGSLQFLYAKPKAALPDLGDLPSLGRHIP